MGGIVIGDRIEKIDGIKAMMSNQIEIYEKLIAAGEEKITYEIRTVAEEKIKKGMYSKVLVETGKQNGYLVPKNAIVIKELYSYLFIIENGEARRVKIERGYSNGDKQEVISDEI